MCSHAIIGCMKTYVMNEKLRMRAYNALIDYISNLIRTDNPDFDRIVDFRKPVDDSEWLHVVWMTSNGETFENDYDFTVLTRTCLISGEEAADAGEINETMSSFLSKNRNDIAEK